MIGLRAIGLGIVLACYPLSGFAQAPVSLAAIDRDLSVLCGRLPNASPQDAATIRARLAALSRQRAAYLAALPEARRAFEVRRSSVSPQCLALAAAIAAPPAANGGSSGGKKHAYRKSSAPTVAAKATGSRAPASVGGEPSRPVVMDRSAPLPSEPPLQEFFPWPPPTPSDRRLLQMSQLGGDTPAATWRNAADRLIAMMRRAGFQAWGFYSAPGGFAVIPRIEQLDSNGAALPGAERWATDVKVASTSLLDGILAVRRPKGVYRAFAFVVTTDPRSGGDITDPRRMLETARRWGLSGALNLPASLRTRSLTPDQQLFALVYEFESEMGGQTKVNVPGRWDLDQHFTNAGVVLAP